MSHFIIATQAKLDLEEIWLYVANEGHDAADRVIDEIVERFSLLAQFPNMGRARDTITEGLRSFPVNRYVIFYKASGDSITVVRVLHGARDIEHLF
jgi:toxin ParE1/3/4